MKAEVEGEQFDEQQPQVSEDKTMIGTTSKVKEDQEVKEEQPKEEQGAMNYISQGLFSIWGAAKDLGGKAKEKIEEAKIGEKLSSAASAVSSTAIAAGSYVKDKTVEIAVGFFYVITRIVKPCRTLRRVHRVG